MKTYPKKKIVCLKCKKVFYVIPSKTYKFCSVVCCVSYHSSKVRKKRKCPGCGLKLYLRVRKTTKQSFCSRDCWIKWFRRVGFKQIVSKLNAYDVPNKSECLLRKIVKPYGFKYQGDGSLFIGKYNPDFVHKSLPLVIELFGEKWHPKEDVSKRRYYFGKHGYKCMIVWYNQLIHSEKRIENRVKSFIAKSA